MIRPARILLAAAFLSMIAGRALHAAGNKKLPVPSDADQAKAMKIVKEIYGAEYEKATSLPDKQALATKLLDEAKNTQDDLPARYVLLKLSKDIATQGLDGLAAIAAVDLIAETFEIDPVVMKTAVLKYGAARAKLPQHHKRLMEAGLFLVDAAVAEDNYAVAKELCDFAAEEAAAANDSNSRDLSIKRGAEVETVLAKLYEKAQSASAMLNADPISPDGRKKARRGQTRRIP
jgi:hypothetical protein